MPSHSEESRRPAVVAKRWHELDTDALYDILRLRTSVFFVEQRIDEEELDGRDRESSTLHVWVPGPNGVAAYLRIIEDPRPEYRDASRIVGRVVTAPEFRGRGLARRLLDWSIERFGSEALVLHSQSYIVGLYAEFGFEVFGDEYVEAGIAHRSMYRAGR